MSVQDHGFELLTTNHYAWTYGPTAVLTIVMSIWTRISYWGKLLQPWQELKTGPTSAEKTVLLDYISPILPINLWNAGRLRHAAILLFIYGGLILKLVTVASTGLLAPVETGLPFENITLETLTIFSEPDYSEFISSSSEPGVPSVVQYEAYALIADKLPFPDGIQPALAFQKFRLPRDSTTTTELPLIRATVEAFRPMIQCEEAELTVLNASTTPCSNGACLEIFSTASWPNCSRSQAYPETIDMIFMYSPLERPSRQLYGGSPYNNVTCDGSFWAFVTMFDVRYNQTSISDAIWQSEMQGDSGSWGIQILQTTAVSCSISYSMVDAMVTYDLAQDPLKPNVELPDNPTVGSRLLDGFAPADFYEAVVFNSDSSGLLAGTLLANGGDEFAPNTFFELMSIVANKSESEFLGNPTDMSSAASTVFTFTGVQIASNYAMNDSTLPLQGEISTRNSRLKISPLASWLMVAGLLCVAAGAIAIVPIRPHDAIPCKMGPLSGMATILGPSPDFQAALRDCGKLQTKDIMETMQLFTFKSKYSSELGFSITPLPKTTTVDSNRRQLPEKGMEFWKPLPLRIWTFSVISVLPVAVIIVLEILQNLSGRTDGIAAIVDPDNLLVTFGTRFIPATLFMTVAILYDSLEFNVAVFAPFARLKRGKATGKHTLTHTLLGRFPIEVLVSALYHGNWAAAFATFGAFLGSFLTIAASGLYTIETMPGMSPVAVNRIDQFNPSWLDSVRDDAGAAVLLTDFEVLNLSYPPWTSSELAFPEIRLSPTDMALINDTSRPAIMVRVPAVRGELQCRFSPPKALSKTDHIGILYVNGSAPVPTGCDVNNPTFHWSSQLALRTRRYPDRSGLLGQMLDLHPGDSNHTFGELTVPLQDNNPSGCPSLAFTFGKDSEYANEYLDWPINTPPDAFTTMWCYQLMAEVQTDVTLSIPDFRVISAVPDESTTKYLASGPGGETAFAWRPQLHFQSEVIIPDGNYTFGGSNSAQITQSRTYPIEGIDGFFALLLHPSTGFREDEMIGANNHDRLLEAIQSVYSRYMAQVASLKMRVPAASSAPETYTASWENSNRGVLRQSPGSKLALQVLLGVMFACGVAAYLLVETSEVLPHDPCSIAGQASLLAGSSLCSEESVAVERPGSGSDQDAFWGSQVFSLGWWPSPVSQGGRFGIDIGEALWMGQGRP